MNPFNHHSRRRLTGMDYARIFASTDGHCAICERKLGPADKWDADHAIALENGGMDEIENMRPVCEWCHVRKTANDHAMAGHARRAYTKHNVPAEFRRSRAWGRNDGRR